MSKYIYCACKKYKYNCLIKHFINNIKQKYIFDISSTNNDTDIIIKTNKNRKISVINNCKYPNVYNVIINYNIKKYKKYIFIFNNLD